MKIMLGDQEVGLGTYVDINTEDATASVEDVMQGEVFYNAEGRQVGTHVCPTVDELLPELSNPATAEQILAGYQAINAEGNLIEGLMSVFEGLNYAYVESKSSGTDNGQSVAFHLEEDAETLLVCCNTSSSGCKNHYYKVKNGVLKTLKNTGTSLSTSDISYASYSSAVNQLTVHRPYYGVVFIVSTGAIEGQSS